MDATSPSPSPNLACSWSRSEVRATALGSAVAALEESGAGAAELTSLRQEKVELVAKVETTSEQLAEVTETHGASEFGP